MSDPSSNTDAIDMLTADHRTVERLFSQAEIGPGREDVVRQIVEELSVHAVIEEQVLYPAVRREVPGGEELADHALEEHQEAKETLASIEKAGLTGPEAETLLTQLISSVREHVREEETDLFPQVKSAFSRQALQEMGAAMAKAKTSAPTHPHPHAPNTPPGNVVGGAAAALVDKARDALRRD